MSKKNRCGRGEKFQARDEFHFSPVNIYNLTFKSVSGVFLNSKLWPSLRSMQRSFATTQVVSTWVAWFRAITFPQRNSILAYHTFFRCLSFALFFYVEQRSGSSKDDCERRNNRTNNKRSTSILPISK